MEKRAKEFLELSGRLYTTNKEKWKKMVDGFDEDVYNETILKVYDSILKGADTQGDLNGYWFKSFKNNLNRNKDYSHKKKRDDTDVIELLKDKEYEENNVNLYYSTISDILLKVKHKFDRKTFEVFRMYLLCDMSYEQLNSITGLCDCKERISRVKKWINEFKDNR
ncbi:MAG: hypothetical protein UHM08_03185 [Bacteroidales bacterium]|nr:hypothetical protein [Bacteroidales bacterium]